MTDSGGRLAVGRCAPEPGAGVEFDELYRAQWWPMIRLAQGLVDDVSSAEDVVQDAFAGLFRNPAALAEAGAAVRYLRVSVVNGARSALRRRRTVRAWLGQVRDGEHAPAADEPARCDRLSSSRPARPWPPCRAGNARC